MRTALLLSVASLALVSAPAAAADVLFSSSGNEATSQTVEDGGVTQIQMDNGAIISIVGPAEFSLDGEILTMSNGGVTVAGGPDMPVTIQLPGNASTVVSGSGSLTINNGQFTGNVMNGAMLVRTGQQERTYRQGQNWWAREGARTSMVMANGAQATPGGPGQSVIRTAVQGRPVTLGAALQSVGASGDVIAASANIAAFQANPFVQSLPSGDVATLLGFSDQLAAALGGSSFNGASPALINTYLQFLANDGQIGAFQAAYAQLVSQYLSLLASGSFGGEFTGADLSGLNTYLAYLQNTNALGQVAGEQQALLNAYLQFLNSGGAPTEFVAPAAFLNEEALAAYVAAINGYAQFLAAGGNPAEFGTSAGVIEAYLQSIASSGLLEQLFGAQSLALNAYLDFLANGGAPGDFTGFDPNAVPPLSDALAAQYVAAIQAYVSFLQGGGAPADFDGGANIITTYLTVLQNAGLFTDLLGAQASTLQAYLDFLAEGGAPADFNFGISDTLAQQYSAAIQAYLDFIANGGVPSEFSGLSASVFQAYLEALADAGLFDTLLADDADFLTAYLAFLQGGGDIDDFDQLPVAFEFPVPQGTLVANQFMALRGSRQELAPFNGQIDRSRSDVVYDDATGAPLYFKFGSTRASIGDAQLIEAGSISDGGVGWGRWVNGTAYAQTDTALQLGSNGIHVIAGPMVTNMPTTGLIEYDFVGGTNPTLTGGEVGSLTTAKAAISYGSTTRVGAELVTEFSDRSYTLQTLGGIAETATNGIALREDLAPGFFFGEVNQTTGGLIEVIGTGAACASGCTGEIRGYISGDEGAELAVSYIASDANGVEVLGAAGFAKGDPLDTGGTPPPPPPPPTDFNTDLVGANFATDFVGSISNYPVIQSDTTVLRALPSLGPVVRSAEGAITDVRDYRDTRNRVRFSNLASELVDQRGDDRSLLLTYAPGDVTFIDSTVTATDYSLLAAVADAAVRLPVGGAVTYDLLFTTPAYSLSDTLADGVFDAQIGVSFGSVPRIGIEGTLDFDTTYTISTQGGLDTLAINRNLTRTDFYIQPVLAGDGALCNVTTACSLAFRGIFSEDFERIATAWSTIGTQVQAYGAAIFGADTVPGLSSDPGAGVSSGSLDAAFDGTAGIIAFTDGGGSNRPQTNRQVFTNNLELAFDDRGITTFTYLDFTHWDRGTLSTADLAGTADWQIGRYNGGGFADGREVSVGTLWGANSGLSYAVIQPFSGTLPASGTIRYTLLGATQPVYADGSTAPGTFDGSMGLFLAASPKIGLEGSVTMPDGSYSFASPGGAADPSQSNFFINPETKVFSSILSVTHDGSGQTCVVGGTCNLAFNGAIGGENGSLAALSYYISGRFDSDTPNISGAAVFGGVTEGGPPPIEGTEVTDQIVAYAATTIGIDERSPADVIYDDTTGAPLAYEWAGNAQNRQDESPNIGTAQQNESGSVSDVIGWTRWAGGTTGGRYFSLTNGVDLPDDGGWHVVAGDPATNLPQSGTVQYELVGSTNPTIRDGSVAPGTFSGELAVAFGSTPMVGIEFDVAIGGSSYAINTPGGVADPMNGGMAVALTGEAPMSFFEPNGGIAVTGNGPVCSGSGDCNALVRGFLSGDGASHVGVVYTFGNTGFDTQVDGSAVFGVAVP